MHLFPLKKKIIKKNVILNSVLSGIFYLSACLLPSLLDVNFMNLFTYKLAVFREDTVQIMSIKGSLCVQ